MPISALDVRTAKLITTTQIITSVYAVVKELIENALDAGADNIEINLVDNGTSLIEVKDNGCGMSKEDAPYMGIASYTSKILSFEDLDTLQTFGFRGEALSALCAVSEVIVTTKTEEDAVGTLYTMNQDGHVVKYESCHRSTEIPLRDIDLLGTTIQARNLFKQVPVRRQIITNTKTANQTIKLLETLIQCFGMCKPNIRIQFRVNNNLIFTKPSLNNIKEAANHILGRKIMSNMEWVEPMDVEFTLQLMLPSKKVQDLSEISHPDLHYVFVNNRPIKHKDLEKLVNGLILEHFEQESHRKRMVFLVYIVLEPMDIDVNLEPNKTIILFKDQNKVFDTIEKCIRKFYGLKSMEITEAVSHDTSACYEDYTLNWNENITDTNNECSAPKKRKIQNAQEKLIQEDVQQKPVLINRCDAVTNGCEDIPRDKQQNLIQNEQHCNDASILTNGCENIPRDKQQNSIQDEQHCKDASILTEHIEPPNLSESDSNDSIPAISSNKMMEEERETLSQLPVVDLGEDFDFTEVTGNCDTFMNENENKINENREKKQVSLEAWSKGHIAGLKGGTDIISDIAIENQLNDDLNSKTSKELTPKRAHVDRKELKFLKHVRLQVSKENPTLTAAQTAKKITEFWKQLSSEERGYYRDVAEEEEDQSCKETEERGEANKADTENNKSRLLQLFEKMKKTKNENKEKLNMRTIVPWIIDRTKIITRIDFENGHIIGRLTSNLWVATICEQIWVVDIIGLINGLKVPNIDPDKIDAKRIEQFLKQWLLERDDMSVMHSIHNFTTKM